MSAIADVHELLHNHKAKRYELWIDGTLAGVATYMEQDGALVFPHFEVNHHRRGSGLASKIAQFALDDVRAQGRKIIPVCPFMVTYLRRHTDQQDLLAEGVTVSR